MVLSLLPMPKTKVSGSRGTAKEKQKHVLERGIQNRNTPPHSQGSPEIDKKGGGVCNSSPHHKCITWGQTGPLQPAFQGLGILAGETFRILHASGLRCSSMVHLGLLLDALSYGTGEALTLGVGGRPLPQTDLCLFIYVNRFYTPRRKSAGAAVTSWTGEEFKSEKPTGFICACSAFNRGSLEQMREDQKHHVRSSRKELGPKSWLGYVRHEPRLKNKTEQQQQKRMCEAPCLKSKFQTGLGDGSVGDMCAVQHEDLSLDMLDPSKKSGVAACTYNPRAGESGRRWQIRGARWQAILAEMASSRLGQRPHNKNTRESSKVDFWSPQDIQLSTHTHVHVCTHMHMPHNT